MASSPSAPPQSELLTFLIADVRGYTRFTVQHGDEAAARLATRFAEIASETAEQHGGRVTELRGDEALAVFTSARQALRAAVALQERFRAGSSVDLPFQVGIGLDAGEVIPVMGGYRGGALNLAARLCSLAGPGEILASQGVVHLARRMEDIAWTERGAVQLKGFTDHVTVFDVMSLAPVEVAAEVPADTPAQVLPVGGFLGALPDSPLVARMAELDRLARSVDAVTTGSGRVVLLSGEPGVGKTRLAQELTLQLRDGGFLIGAGRCYQSRAGVPFYPFLDVLGTLYAAGSAAVRGQTVRSWTYLAKLVPEISPTSILASESSEERERLFRAVTSFVCALAGERPVALLLDDLHWADESSLDLLLHLARGTRAKRVLILGTYRDEEVARGQPLEGAILELTRERLSERVQVPRLDSAATAELAASLFGFSDLPPDLGEILHQRTDGNAFFIGETVRAVLDRGMAHPEDVIRNLESVAVSENVRALVGQRVERLSEGAQHLLRYAAVLGQQFGFDALLALAARIDDERPEDDVERHLEEAMAVGLVREAGRDTFAFRHALIQQTLYDELPPRRRRRLHRAAGEALQRSTVPGGKARAADVARHFREGDEPALALEWSLAAGSEARGVFAYAEAERYYRQAAELAEELHDSGQEVEALERLGEVLEAAARYDESLATFDRALALLDPATDLDRVRRITARAGGSCFFLGRTEEGLSRLTALVATDAPDTPGLARVYAHLGLAYMFMGDMEALLRVAERGSAIARRFGDRESLAFTEQWRGYAIGGREGIEILDEARRLAEDEGSGFFIRTAWLQASDLYEQIGDLAGTGNCYMHAIEIAELMGDPDWLSFLYAWDGRNLFLRGRWTEARERCRLAQSIAPPEVEGFMAAYPPAVLGQVLLATGEIEAGRALIDQGTRIAERNQDVQALCLALPPPAEHALLIGDAEQAIERLEPALESVRHSFFGHFCTVPLASAYARTGRLDAAERLLTEQMEGEGARMNRTALPGLLRAMGGIRAQTGQWDEAEVLFRQAAEVAREIGYPLAEAMAHFERGEAAERHAATESARVGFQHALDIFLRLGAEPYVFRARQALAEL